MNFKLAFALTRHPTATVLNHQKINWNNQGPLSIHSYTITGVQQSLC